MGGPTLSSPAVNKVRIAHGSRHRGQWWAARRRKIHAGVFPTHEYCLELATRLVRKHFALARAGCPLETCRHSPRSFRFIESARTRSMFPGVFATSWHRWKDLLRRLLVGRNVQGTFRRRSRRICSVPERANSRNVDSRSGKDFSSTS